MKVKTNIISGEKSEPVMVSPIQSLSSAVDMFAVANNIVQDSLTDPDALKRLMTILPPANLAAAS